MRRQPVSYLTLPLRLAFALLVVSGSGWSSRTPPLAAQGSSSAYPTVTDERLQRPEAGDWLMYRRTYDGSGFSPLKQITSSNVNHLTLAWSMSTDLLGAHETTPIVNRGRMFITTPQNNVIAFDATTGTQLWRYARKYPDGLFQLHPTNRGVALYGDYVYMEDVKQYIEKVDVEWNSPILEWGTNLTGLNQSGALRDVSAPAP